MTRIVSARIPDILYEEFKEMPDEEESTVQDWIDELMYGTVDNWKYDKEIDSNLEKELKDKGIPLEQKEAYQNRKRIR